MKINVSRDSIHDQLVATYQSLEASLLNTALMESGISDAAQREKVISSFLFAQGVVLDQSWFEEQGARWYPGVYFSTMPHENLDAATVHLPSEQYGMNFHEYAQGAATWAIENQENPKAIEVGNAHE